MCSSDLLACVYRPDVRIVADGRFNASAIRLQISNYFRCLFSVAYGARQFGGHVLIFRSDCAGSGLDNRMAACMDNRMAACMAACIRHSVITRHMQRTKNPSTSEGLEEKGLTEDGGIVFTKGR